MQRARRALRLGVTLLLAGMLAAGAPGIRRADALPLVVRRPAQLPPDSLFRRLILLRRQAYGRGDSAAYGRLLADDVVHISDLGVRRTRAALVAHVGAKGGGAARFEVSALQVRLVGPETAVVDCEVFEYMRLGSRDVRITARELNVFRQEAGVWRLLAHAETPEVTSPAVVAVPAARLQDYAGVYEWWPGYRETYTVRHGRLLVQATGDSAAVPLDAAAPDAFFAPGDPSVGFFVRDASGRVQSLLVHFADGRVVVARRVR